MPILWGMEGPMDEQPEAEEFVGNDILDWTFAAGVVLILTATVLYIVGSHLHLLG